MNICIIGGGNIGTAIAADIAIRKKHNVSVLTTKSDIWMKSIKAIDMETKASYVAEIDKVTSNDKEALYDADIVLITLPSFMMEKSIKNMVPFLKNGAAVGIIPGTGGAEFYSKELTDKGHVFFGLDRVPCVARVKEYGRSVYTSKKKSVRVAAIPREQTGSVCLMLTDVLDMICEPLTNYLTVTLTPSNPIMHTARLYTMFKDYVRGMTWDYNIPFYGQWDDEASKMLLACDDELQELCKAIDGLDLSGVIPLRKHYESKTAEQLTSKIKSIVSLKNIESPMYKVDSGFVPDFQSRYFTEDMPFGLCTIKGFCLVCGLSTPNIDKILYWYERVGGKEYFIDGYFKGADLNSAAVPQLFGIKTIDDIVKYYS